MSVAGDKDGVGTADAAGDAAAAGQTIGEGGSGGHADELVEEGEGFGALPPAGVGGPKGFGWLVVGGGVAAGAMMDRETGDGAAVRAKESLSVEPPMV